MKGEVKGEAEAISPLPPPITPPITSSSVEAFSSSAWNGSKASVMVPFRVEVLAFFIMGTFSPIKERKINLTATVLPMVPMMGSE